MKFRRPFASLFVFASILALVCAATVKAAAPSNLLYPGGNLIRYCPGQTITPATPTVTGTGVTYSIGPGQNSGSGIIFTPAPGSGINLQGGHAFSLPPGLSFDPATGTISGTPTAAFAPTNYTVTAMNAQGSVPITLAVSSAESCPSLAPPGGPPVFVITYATFCKNVPVNGPTYVGLSNLTSVTPTLPAGLSISTGEVLGIPTAATASAAYTFGNGTGISRTQNITVQENCQPLVLTSSSRVHNLCAGNTIDTIRYPVVSGGPIVECGIAGLPAGLSLNAATCEVTGVPATGFTGNFWTVSGFVSADHGVAYDTSLYAIQSCPAVPSIDYPASDTLCLSQSMETLTPIIGGGVATACTPQGLPQGLTLSPAPACAISGTPAQSVTPGSYPVTVTATIGGTSVPQTLSLVVKNCTDCANAWVVQQPALLNPAVTGKALFSIDFNRPVNHRVGHIAGTTGIIRFTDNNGADGWPAQASGVIQDLWAITCSQVQTGYPNGKCYVGGGLGTLMSSLNADVAGATWTPESCPDCGNATIRGLNCPSTCNNCGNAEFCLAVGDGGLIRRKTTSGIWVAPASTGGNTQGLNSVVCKLRNGTSDIPANYTCYAAGNLGTFMKSIDGGNNWSVITTYTSAINFNPVTTDFNEVSFNDENIGWVAVDKGHLLYTSDGGATAGGWAQLSPAAGNKNLYGLDTRWGSSLWAVGAAAALSYSHLPQTYYQLPSPFTIYGWTAQSNPAVYDLYAAYALDSCEAWVVGENGMVIKTNTCACMVTTGVEHSDRVAPEPGMRFGLSGDGSLWYEASSRTPVDLRLFDSRGREVGRFFTRKVDAGRRMTSQPMRGLQPGTYFLRARREGGTAETIKAVFTGK